MKMSFKFSIVLMLLAIALQQAESGLPPTFNMSVKNFRMFPAAGNQDSILEFDVYCHQTNFGSPGVDPFEYCCGQFTWVINKAALGAPGTQNFFTIRSSQLPVDLVPPFTQIDAENGYLIAGGNLPYHWVNYFISSAFPGTLMAKYRLRTSARIFPIVPLDIKFKLSNPSSTFIGYFLPYPDTLDTETFPPPVQTVVLLTDTVSNEYWVDCNLGHFSCTLPVELSAFSSKVDKNLVYLNWTTVAEINNSGFEIERTESAIQDWTNAGFVEGFGTTDETKNYSFNERVSSGRYKYRLKQIDFNGGFNYHPLNNEVIVGIPAAYYISQNYPNPFNPETRIDFELPVEGKVSISIYDISGREVSKLVNGIFSAGYHGVRFNGSNYSSGMYFYRIIVQGGVQNFLSTKKMMLVK